MNHSGGPTALISTSSRPIADFSVPEIITHVFATNLALVALAAASVLWPGPLSTVAALGGGSALVGWLLYRFSRGKS